MCAFPHIQKKKIESIACHKLLVKICNQQKSALQNFQRRKKTHENAKPVLQRANYTFETLL